MDYKMRTANGYRVSVTGTLASDYYKIDYTGKRYGDFRLENASFKTNYTDNPIAGAGLDKIRNQKTFEINLDKNKNCEYIYTDKKGDIKLMDDVTKSQRLISGQNVTVVMEVDVRPNGNHGAIMSFNPVCVGFHDEPRTYERERDRQLALFYLGRTKASGMVINKNGAEQLAMDILNADKSLSPAQKTTELMSIRDKIVYAPQENVDRLLKGMNIPHEFSDYETAYFDRDKIMEMYEITEEDVINFKNNNPEKIKPFEYVASPHHDPQEGIQIEDNLEFVMEDNAADTIRYTDDFDIGD